MVDNLYLLFLFEASRSGGGILTRKYCRLNAFTGFCNNEKFIEYKLLSFYIIKRC